MLKIEKSIFLSKPVIGIVGRKIDNIYKVNENIIKKVIKYDGIPILLLPNDNLNEILNICDGIIMPGGNNIYDYDKYICDYCIKNDIPLLGICLGMQIMCNEKLKRIENHQGVNHKIIIKDNTKLSNIIKNNIVNSRHNECVIDTSNYIVSALSNDGVIEAIEHKTNKFNIGVQWHPEDLDDDLLFFELIKEAKIRNNCNKSL